MAAAAVFVAASSLVACDESNDRTALSRTENPEAPSSAAPPPAPPPPPGAFTFGSDVVLLPFDVRLAKVARVAGVPVTDPLLEPLRKRRLDLGDYDYANGQKPDTSWTSSRLATWVKLLRPVCNSPQMRTRFASLPDKLGDLVLAAYGRKATDDDRRAVDEALAGAPLDEPGRYQVVCLTVLSSLEFVAR